MSIQDSNKKSPVPESQNPKDGSTSKSLAKDDKGLKKGWVQRLLAKAEHPAYPLILGGIAAVDYILFLVPIAPLTVASVAVVPKRWWKIALFLTIGSFLGSMIFFFLISHYGTAFLDAVAPHMREGAFWTKMEGWVAQFGVWALLFVSFAPTVDHPIIAIAAMTKMNPLTVAVALLVGKTLKFFLLAGLGAYAPNVLKKLKIIPS